MNPETIYGKNFHATRHQKTQYSADVILGIVLPFLPNVNRAIDIGCGVGTWLKSASDKGVTSVAGYDGPWVDRKLLQIPESCFHQTNLAESLDLTDGADLAISLEVFEHLPESAATERMDLLLSKCRFLLFGAAVPLQGGTGHINEKPQSYWVDYITSRGFVAYDPIRARIWNDRSIPYWYKQNILLYVNEEDAQRLPDELSRYRVAQGSLIDVIHPELLEKKNRKAERHSRGFVKRLLGMFLGKSK